MNASLICAHCGHQFPPGSTISRRRVTCSCGLSLEPMALARPRGHRLLVIATLTLLGAAVEIARRIAS